MVQDPLCDFPTYNFSFILRSFPGGSASRKTRSKFSVFIEVVLTVPAIRKFVSLTVNVSIGESASQSVLVHGRSNSHTE